MPNLKARRGQSARCDNGPQSRRHKSWDAGQGLIEYILVVVLMGIMALTVVKTLGQKTQAGFTKATDNLSRELGV